MHARAPACLRQLLAQLERASQGCSRSAASLAESMKTLAAELAEQDVNSISSGVALLTACAKHETVTLWVDAKVLLTQWESSEKVGEDTGPEVQAFIHQCGEVCAKVEQFFTPALDAIASVVGGPSGLKNDAFPCLRTGAGVRGLARILKVFKARMQ